MPFIPVPDTVQARLVFQTDDGIVAQNVLYCASTDPIGLTDLEDIGLVFHEWLEASLMPVVTTNWSAIGVFLRDMSVAEGDEILYDLDFPVPGTDAGTQVPLQVAYTVTWNTGLVGRSARGRTYGVGLTAGEIEDNTRLKDIAQAAFQTNWDALRALMETNGHALQVVSFQEGGVPRAAGRPLPVLSTNVRFPLATQRRRLS